MALSPPRVRCYGFPQRMITFDEAVDALPVIASLVLIEGLLSIDNALAVAAFAAHLPKHQQKFALRIGISGAYFFRGVALLLVSLIIANPWLKIAGAVYLIYLMASHVLHDDEEETGADINGSRSRSLWMTVLQIEAMDLALGLDNVVAAVALDRRFWVVCTGVFLGILTLRFVADYGIRLITKFPSLNATAFLLIGFVGIILLVEACSELAGHPVHINTLEKFGGIVTILALSLWYDRTAAGEKFLRPIVVLGAPVLWALDRLFGVLFWPLAIGVRLAVSFYVRYVNRAGSRQAAGRSGNR